MNPPLRLLAIDPALVSTGIAVVTVGGYNDVKLDYQFTVTTNHLLALPARVAMIADQVEAAVPAEGCLCEKHRDDYVVIEEPSQHFARGRRTSTKAIFRKAVGYGAALSGLRTLYGEDWDRVTAVGVNRWYPRDGSATMKKTNVIKMISALYSDAELTEHTAMALGMSLWWSRTIAPPIWAELERGISRETLSQA